MTFTYKKINNSKYKYELTSDLEITLKFKPPIDILDNFYQFYTSGKLVVNKGYRWDGASGPTFDTESTMVASCVHDVLYQMMRMKQLALNFKEAADLTLRWIMSESSKSIFNKIRSSYFYYAVKFFGSFACKPK